MSLGPFSAVDFNQQTENHGGNTAESCSAARGNSQQKLFVLRALSVRVGAWVVRGAPAVTVELQLQPSSALARARSLAGSAALFCLHGEFFW